LNCLVGEIDAKDFFAVYFGGGFYAAGEGWVVDSDDELIGLEEGVFEVDGRRLGGDFIGAFGLGSHAVPVQSADVLTSFRTGDDQLAN
jgi:hypothetical protein